MWETPIYRFNQEVGNDEEGNRVYKQVVIDVTGSAPSFSSPGIALKSALARALKAAGVSTEDTILDFGAGKLRNAIFLLEKGYRVCAVEFAQQFSNSEIARENLARAQSEFKDRFSKLVYPHAFEASRQRFKLILLINVINIMPVPAERDYVLALCNQRLADSGRLLWYTQRGDAHYQQRLNPQYQLGDGVYVGRTTYHKTFYREYEVKDIDALLRRAGFDYDQKIEATWRNQSRLYKKTGPAVLADVLTPKSIDQAKVNDNSIPDPKRVKTKKSGRARKKYEPRRITSAAEKRKGKANPDRLSPEAQLIEALKHQAEGDKHAEAYDELIRRIFEQLFPDVLHKFRFAKLPPDSNIRDLMAENKSAGGFFTSLRKLHGLVSLRIVVRCRNHHYSDEHPAFDQLTAGMDRNLGFGFLTYRSGNRNVVIERCRRYFLVSETATAIVPLDDNDLSVLLRLKLDQKTNDIDSFLSERLRHVTTPVKVFLSYSREDSKFMNEIDKALSTLKKRGAVELWVDRSGIQSGNLWKNKIQVAVSQADMAIFLIGNNSLGSRFIDPFEVDPLLKAQDNRGVKIIPVLLSSCDLPDKLSRLHFVNDGKAVRDLSIAKRDKVWLQVVEEIESAFSSIKLRKVAHHA